MRGGARGRSMLVAVVLPVFLAGLPWLMFRPSEAEPPVASVLLDNEDLGDIETGFQRRLSEASQEPLPLPGWIPPAVGRIVRVPTHVRGWVEPDTDRRIVVVGSQLPLPLLTSAVLDGLVSSVAADSADEFAIAEVPGARGFVIAPNGPDNPAREYWAMLGKGRFVFTVFVATPEGTDGRDLQLARRLVQTQAAKAPEAPSAVAPPSEPQLAARFAAGMLAALLAYVGLASLTAWALDPLARAGGRSPADSVVAVQATHASAGRVVDVTDIADRWRLAGRVRLVVQLVGVAVAAPGLFPFTWPLGVAFVAVGAVMAGLPRVVAADRHLGVTTQPRLMPRRRRLRVAAYSSISGLCVLAGLAGVGLFGVGAAVTSPLFAVNVAIVGVSITLVAAGSLLYRHARRLAASAAREVLETDPRPMVLYLRAFADDTLTLRSARYARALLLERLSPRGFDRFEQVIARTLNAVGPVVAVNPPGTKLAPLGAARDTLDPDDWQSQVAGRIAEAGLIVVGAAPDLPAPGLAWELSAVDRQGRWPATVLVLPPVPANDLRRRWARFEPLLDDTAMADHPLPADPAQALVVAGSPASGWTAITAARRDEWTYAAALATAAERTTAPVDTAGQLHEP